jgi:hypothetical protein
MVPTSSVSFSAERDIRVFSYSTWERCNEVHVHWNFSKPDPQKTSRPWISANFFKSLLNNSLQRTWRKSHKTGHPSKLVLIFGPSAGWFREFSQYYHFNKNFMAFGPYEWFWEKILAHYICTALSMDVELFVVSITISPQKFIYVGFRWYQCQI